MPMADLMRCTLTARSGRRHAAHVRRKFFDLHQARGSPVAAEAIRRIGALYAIETSIRGKPPQERQAARDARASPLLVSLHGWLQETLRSLSQKSALAEAIRYALKLWAALVRYTGDGRIEIDNNAAERSLRAVAVGRKKLFVRRFRCRRRMRRRDL